jgi:hypothetical protein
MNPPTHQRERSQWAQRFVNEWSELIGPDYAQALLPVRVITFVGASLFILGISAGLPLSYVLVPHTSLGTDLAYWLALDGPGLALLIIGVGWSSLVGRRIRRKLVAGGYGDPGSTPDLTSRYRLRNWAKYNGVPIANIGLAISGVRQERLGP